MDTDWNQVARAPEFGVTAKQCHVTPSILCCVTLGFPSKQFGRSSTSASSRIQIPTSKQPWRGPHLRVRVRARRLGGPKAPVVSGGKTSAVLKPTEPTDIANVATGRPDGTATDPATATATMIADESEIKATTETESAAEIEMETGIERGIEIEGGTGRSTK